MNSFIISDDKNPSRVCEGFRTKWVGMIRRWWFAARFYQWIISISCTNRFPSYFWVKVWKREQVEQKIPNSDACSAFDTALAYVQRQEVTILADAFIIKTWEDQGAKNRSKARLWQTKISAFLKLVHFLILFINYVMYYQNEVQLCRIMLGVIKK